ncbi:Outer membrane protein assembly factor BamB, contains PQQ-like beta-propeller repeat [Halovenus aranensis]|uniref:Outer membrane protein assembly factor BamB, contains PQQ-like beta-propeller repeat n=1 Tax=Halovenus aranensis TaxID=890420 RepID=A0A1G8X083_9EURY|nr:PQQ-binding-like beta-propeller repeat protein [Halovenus aranensis]SDJ84032.1 Outer membrane protein assembly factor BamB, contains PQQ-like beta-propeller repeat [Halovenus aranensis]
MPSYTRRQALAGIVATSIAGCLSRPTGTGSLDDLDGSWPVAGGNVGHSRTVSGVPSNPETVWTTELPDTRSVGTPAIVDGQVYVPVDSVSEQARHRYGIHALSGETGTERWQVPLRAEPNGPPAVTAGRILASGKRSTERGRLVAFSEPHGEEEWLYDVDARVTAPPTFDVTTVFLPDWSGTVHALSAVDGSVRWARRVGTAAGQRTFPHAAAVENGRLYLGSSSGQTGVVAVDAETGETDWSRSTPRVTAGPVVHDGLVVAQTGSVVRAFDTDGGELWAVSLPNQTPRRLQSAVDDSHVYVTRGATTYALTREGKQDWTYDHNAAAKRPPTVAGDAVLVPEDDAITAIDRTDGTTLWQTKTDGQATLVTASNALLTSNSSTVTARG